ncbi:hypothetical protein X975_17971, partial [Stegodyphus mimosarum]
MFRLQRTLPCKDIPTTIIITYLSDFLKTATMRGDQVCKQNSKWKVWHFVFSLQPPEP